MAGKQSATNRIAGLIDTATGTPVDFQSAVPPIAGQVPTATGPSTIAWQTPTAGAPVNAQYLVLAADPTLLFERVFTPGAGLAAVDSGPGAAYTVSIDQTASLNWTGTQSFQDTKFFIVDVTDATKRLAFDIAGTTGTTSTIAWAPTTTRTMTVPDTTDTLVTLAFAQTLTNKTIDSATNIVRADKLSTTGSPVVVNTAAPPTVGQVLQATGATAAAWQTLALGFSPMTLVDVTGLTQLMSPNTGYMADNAALVVLTLPTTAAFGSEMKVVGHAAGGWKIAQNSGQTVRYGNQVTTAGAGGSISSTDAHDVITLVCTVANTEFTVESSVGNHLMV